MSCNTTIQPCGCNTPNCTGCTYTLNTDCIFFNKERLDYEPESIVDNSTRTLTTILQNVENIVQGSMDSEFHTIGDGAFTLQSNSANKVIFLDDIEGLIGASAVITLPVNDLSFVGKVFTFVNRTPAANGSWSFNVPLTVDYDPLTTQTAYNSIVSAGTKVLKLIFTKTNQLNYGWIILQN